MDNCLNFCDITNKTCIKILLGEAGNGKSLFLIKLAKKLYD